MDEDTRETAVWPSGEEEKEKEKLLYPHPKLSLGLVLLQSMLKMVCYIDCWTITRRYSQMDLTHFAHEKVLCNHF